MNKKERKRRLTAKKICRRDDGLSRRRELDQQTVEEFVSLGIENRGAPAIRRE